METSDGVESFSLSLILLKSVFTKSCAFFILVTPYFINFFHKIDLRPCGQQKGHYISSTCTVHRAAKVRRKNVESFAVLCTIM